MYVTKSLKKQKIRENMEITVIVTYTGWPKKVSHYQVIKKSY